MTEAISYLVGIGVVAGIFSVILYNIREEHNLMRFFILLLLVTLGFLVSKTFFDARTTCETVVANSTTVSNITTSYEYTSFCFTTTTSTPGTFYTIMMWAYYIIIAYVVVWVFINIITSLGDLRSRK